LRSAGFQGASRRARLLRYLVEQALNEHNDALKESVIAVEVFDRPADFDPQVDSSVRVEVGRLRSRLTEYYAQNLSEPVRIEIPKGAYRPVFTLPEAPAVVASSPERGIDAKVGVRKWKWAAIFAAAVALVGAGVLIWRSRGRTPAAPAAIAVLPFLNLSGSSSDEYLADGITDELTEALAEFTELRVVARTSAFQYKGKGTDVRQIGRNLGVGAVLEGSAARQNDGRLRVIAQLVRTSDGYHLWSHTYESTLGELHEVESGIAQAARDQLVAAPKRAAPREAGTRNPEAHDLYIRAVYAFNQHTPDGTRDAIQLAGEATEKDPSFAQPYVLMASAESQLNTLFVQRADVTAKHESEDLEKALALDPGNSAAHALKAMLVYTEQWDWPQAEREFGLALASGSHGAAENSYGWCLMTRGRFSEAHRRLERASELDPLSLGPQLNLVAELVSENKSEEAKRIANRVLNFAPKSPAALAVAMQVAFFQGDCATETRLGETMIGLYPGSPNKSIVKMVEAKACGRADLETGALAELARTKPSEFPSPYQVAGAFALGNDDDRALSFLEMSAERHEPVLMAVAVDRAFDSLRHDARFIALERRLGLIE
jgi:TolB-like protein/Tfp pilus assembly protein PilF